MAWRTSTLLPVLACSAVATASAFAAPPRELDKADYTERLNGMWLAEVLANWTGIRSEGRRQWTPFHTDADWGTAPYPTSPGIVLDYHLHGNPWYADDDTDIEHVYLHLLTQHAPATRLTAAQIRDGWMIHINHDIWVSNAAARALMNTGARPPATAFAQGMVPPNYADQSMMIDAQLTTEFFGALAPGMPGVALALADLPIRATAGNFAAHAAQFYVVLYSLATQVDPTSPPSDQVIWLVREARKFIPDTSKTADIADFILADHLANPDKDDWERTRDRVFERYQLNAAANGFTYRAWYESSVNFATGLIALLYGELSLPKTIRIGTLSGWDSDNGTATIGGLLGLMAGSAGVISQFPGWNPSDRFWAGRTRDGLPDYLPADPAADDTLTLMAQRCIPIIDRVVAEAGGRVSAASWLLAPGGAGTGLTPAAALLNSPTHRETLRSANARALAAGATPIATADVPGSPESTYGSGYILYLVNGAEHEFRGREMPAGARGYYSTQRPGGTPSAHTLTVNYPTPVPVHTVRFVEGDHFPTGPVLGGWFESIAVEALVGGSWIPAAATASEPLDPAVPFQVVDLLLDVPVTATGVRVRGVAGGTPGFVFVTCAELDALLTPLPPAAPGFDRDGDGTAGVEDLYAWWSSPVDLNSDGMVGEGDSSYLRCALRWEERGLGGR